MEIVNEKEREKQREGERRRDRDRRKKVGQGCLENGRNTKIETVRKFEKPPQRCLQ